MDKKSEYLELMKNRENLYRFLGRLYRVEVDGPLLQQMKAMRFPVECSETELSEGYLVLSEYLDNCSSDPLTDLAVDYTKVFLGAGIAEGSAAYPYESVYTSKKRVIMQEAWEQVTLIYAAKGLSKDDERPELFEDHISLELQFMSFLCHEAQCVLDTQNESEFLSCLKQQMDFLSQHLLKWVPSFCADVEKYAGTEFYKGIGKITNGYLRLDSAMLKSSMDELL
ncbi:TorD/DmsD family molecular chaperone [Clostridium lacusfryxellense]|uniref:TorD/DmsD family molecular chaperone n=1 Tax=Clostridium lacusfryxellense TaxID=205328 RepID=UPI001C0ABEB7|nr:molecular chaperone TorD family protein [Clostridium lacusfryxellense]MBU3112629.1 molecular chaperone TorD family protein [Clostridium lacusfryxellense]